MGLLSRSHALLGSAWRIFKTKRELIWLPFWAIVSSVVVSILVALAAMLAAFISGLVSPTKPISYFNATTLLIFLLNMAANFYFLASGIQCTAQILRTKTTLIRNNLSLTLQSLWPISLWAILNGIVVYLPDLLFNKQMGIAYLVIKLTLYFFWSLFTYLVIPLIVLEKLPVAAAIRQSFVLIKKVWAEATVIITEVTSLVFVAIIIGVIFVLLGLKLMHFLQPSLAQLGIGAVLAAKTLLSLIAIGYFLSILLISWVVSCAIITLLYYSARDGFNGNAYLTVSGA